MSATGRIAVDKVANGVLVVPEAIFEKNGGSVAYVLRGSKFEERPVQVEEVRRVLDVGVGVPGSWATIAFSCGSRICTDPEQPRTSTWRPTQRNGTA